MTKRGKADKPSSPSGASTHGMDAWEPECLLDRVVVFEHAMHAGALRRIRLDSVDGPPA